jgi:hypothetical protein
LFTSLCDHFGKIPQKNRFAARGGRGAGAAAGETENEIAAFGIETQNQIPRRARARVRGEMDGGSKRRHAPDTGKTVKKFGGK